MGERLICPKGCTPKAFYVKTINEGRVSADSHVNYVGDGEHDTAYTCPVCGAEAYPEGYDPVEKSIQIILEKPQRTARHSAAVYTSRNGIPTFIDRAHAIAHNKVMIIDMLTVITGSFNFTKAAEESNAENMLIIRSSALAQLYMTNWNYHKKHSGECFLRGTVMQRPR